MMEAMGQTGNIEPPALSGELLSTTWTWSARVTGFLHAVAAAAILVWAGREGLLADWRGWVGMGFASGFMLLIGCVLVSVARVRLTESGIDIRTLLREESIPFSQLHRVRSYKAFGIFITVLPMVVVYYTDECGFKRRVRFLARAAMQWPGGIHPTVAFLMDKVRANKPDGATAQAPHA